MTTVGILQWVPNSLYNLSVSVIVCNYQLYRTEVKSLPDSVQFDVFYKVRTFFYPVQSVGDFTFWLSLLVEPKTSLSRR